MTVLSILCVKNIHLILTNSVFISAVVVAYLPGRQVETRSHGNVIVVIFFLEWVKSLPPHSVRLQQFLPFI